MSGVDSAALEAVISSFYSGECPVSIDTVCAVHDAASKLEVPDLLQSCVTYVSTSLSSDNVSSIMGQAQQLKDVQIIELCRQFLLSPGRCDNHADKHHRACISLFLALGARPRPPADRCRDT